MILFEDVLVVGGVLVFFVEKNARATDDGLMCFLKVYKKIRTIMTRTS